MPIFIKRSSATTTPSRLSLIKTSLQCSTKPDILVFKRLVQILVRFSIENTFCQSKEYLISNTSLHSVWAIFDA